MAGFISTVRFLVKEECVDEFIRMHNSPDGINQKGIGIKQYMTQTKSGVLRSPANTKTIFISLLHSLPTLTLIIWIT